MEGNERSWQVLEDMVIIIRLGRSFKVLEDHMRSWKVIEVNTKFILGSFWKFMEGHVRSLIVMEVRRRSWKVMEGHGMSWNFILSSSWSHS